MVFLEPYARPLLLLRSAAAIVLIGTSTHHGVLVRALPWNPRFNVRLSRVYAPVSGVSYLVTWALGALAYPTYRSHVRAAAGWASELFEVKEEVAILGGLLAFAAWWLARAVDRGSGRIPLTLYAVLVWTVAIVVWFEVFSGLKLCRRFHA